MIAFSLMVMLLIAVVAIALALTILYGAGVLTVRAIKLVRQR